MEAFEETWAPVPHLREPLVLSLTATPTLKSTF